MASRRLILDVSTLARAGGQTVGIVRVVRELARYARARRSDTVFAIYDRAFGGYREVDADWTAAIVDGSAIVDLSAQPVAGAGGPLPCALLWLRRPRRRAYVALQRLRLAHGLAAAGRLADRLLSAKDRAELTDPKGNRRTLLPFAMAAGAPVAFGPQDMLVIAGSEWGGVDFEALRAAKAAAGFSVAVLIHDLIPLFFPAFYRPHEVETFRRYVHALLPIADLVVFTGRQGETDARAYAQAEGIPIAKSAVAPLGADPAGAQDALRLPGDLIAGRYALYVSTIEPRKNHALLLKVWRRLCDEGIPQAHGFKLALVGRTGWMVDDLLAELRAETAASRGLVLLQGINDAQLGALYRGAAFLTYPSLYEGYGLPIVEGFQHGKTALISTGGALADLSGPLALGIDPRDEGGWYDALKRWIAEPQARAPYEAALRDFRHPTWDEAASRFFATIDRELPDR